MTLVLDKVQVSIEGVRVLRGVSCEILARKTTILIGRNGAGKTTTLRAIMGLLPLDGGDIRLFDLRGDGGHRGELFQLTGQTAVDEALGELTVGVEVGRAAHDGVGTSE